jgi:hypothetical protein
MFIIEFKGKALITIAFDACLSYGRRVRGMVREGQGVRRVITCDTP